MCNYYDVKHFAYCLSQLLHTKFIMIITMINTWICNSSPVHASMIVIYNKKIFKHT